MAGEVTTYVASIHVTRTIKTPATAQTRPAYGETPKTNATRVTDSFRLTVRAPSLEKLIEKMDAHMGLVDDEDFGEEKVIR